MKKYHINPNTGNPGVCRAEEKCRFEISDSEHFKDETSARKAYEEEMMEEFGKIDTADIVGNIALKDMDAALLATTLFKEAQQNGLAANYIASSIDVASILHARQSRTVRAGYPKTPYVEHPLRNGIRLMRMGVKDEDIIVAAVLHDTIEDGSDVFVQKYLKKEPGTESENRDKLSIFIKAKYGERTLRIVQAVTNPLESEEDPSLSKHENYRRHVVKQISDSPEAYLVKISDLFDNAGSLYHQDKSGNERMLKRLSSKYLPLIEAFRERSPSVKSLVSERGYSKIIDDLRSLESRLSNISDKYQDLDFESQGGSK